MKHVGIVATVAIVLPLLGGCVTPTEQRASDDGRCRQYGFRPGTDAFAECRQRIDLDRSADKREFLNRPSYGGFGYGRFWY